MSAPNEMLNVVVYLTRIAELDKDSEQGQELYGFCLYLLNREYSKNLQLEVADGID